MTYLDFTLEILERDFAIKARDHAIFSLIGEIAPSARLEESLRAAADVVRVQPVSKEPFVFAISGQASSIPSRNVLSIIKVVRALKHVIQYRDFPGGIRWSEPVPVGVS